MDNSRQAIVFPGQGTQKTGMGKDFYENSIIARNTYQEASEALGYDVADMCFEEDERLNLTEYAQPCILTTEVAMYRVIDDQWGLNPVCFGGHSLGEYTALVTAGVLPFPEALRVVRERGRLMQKATPLGMGGMAAVIAEGLDMEELGSIIMDLPVDIANCNSTRQVVISGEKNGLAEAEALISSNLGGREAFRFVPLTVSAPFHSRFMKAINEPFRKLLEEIKDRFNTSAAHLVTSNFTGEFHLSDTKTIIEWLVSQLSGTVRWKDNMKAIASRAGDILEIGPGRPLKDFFKTINVTCRSITTLSTAERTFSQDGKNT
ncbi:MAG: ACP S-malonyltransferase [Syntrophales bacterium]|nr:ACP S-malonyltransferase [Syntrophales bacterium]